MSTSYIGSKISLISRAEIRYEGTLFMVDQEKSTITLSKVRTFGTENRETEHPMPPRDEVFEYIIFKATDIKDIMVCELAQAHGGLPFDPAIVSVSVNKSPGLQPPQGTGPPGGHHQMSTNFGPGPVHQQQQQHLLTSTDLSSGVPKYDSSRLSSPPLSPHQQQQQQQFLHQNKAPGAGRQQQQQQPSYRQDFYSSIAAAAAHHQSPPGQQQQQMQQHQMARSYSRRDEDVESVDEARSRSSFQSRGADINMYRQQQQQRGSFSSSRGSRTQDRPSPFHQPQNFRGVSSGAYRMGGGGAPVGGGNHFVVDGSYRDRAVAGFQQQRMMPQQQQMPRGLSIAGGGRGGSVPWGSGRGGAFVSRGFLQQHSSSSSRGGPRGGGTSQPGSFTKRFDSDYDFEKANEQFIEAMNNLKDDFSNKAKIGGTTTNENDENHTVSTTATNKVNNESSSSSNKTDVADAKNNAATNNNTNASNNDHLKKDDGGKNDANENNATYDKQKSFFDNISCEALEILEGANASRSNYRRERELNQETFGQSSLQHRNFGSYRRGYGRFNGPSRGGSRGGFNSRATMIDSSSGGGGGQRGAFGGFNRYR